MSSDGFISSPSQSERKRSGKQNREDRPSKSAVHQKTAKSLALMPGTIATDLSRHETVHEQQQLISLK